MKTPKEKLKEIIEKVKENWNKEQLAKEYCERSFTYRPVEITSEYRIYKDALQKAEEFYTSQQNQETWDDIFQLYNYSKHLYFFFLS